MLFHGQKYSSARSSIKQTPAGFMIVDRHFGWQPDTVNFDIGGGKYDLMTEKLSEKFVTNLIFDPYNRNVEHNNCVLQRCLNGKSDTVTIFNVLNVIMEPEIQMEVLDLARDALKPGGRVFIRSTYMNQNKASGLTKSGTFQHCLKQSEYLKIVKKIFPDAELKFGIIFAKK